MSKHKKTIFLSYSWKDAAMANAIDNRLKLIPSLDIKRDVRDVKAFANIKDFMQQIKDQDYALVLISDSFLKSENCMYEILELFKSKKLKDKIMLIRVNKVDIFSYKGNKQYAKYWYDEIEKIEQDIQDKVRKKRKVPPHYYDQQKQYEKITDDIESILNDIQGIKLTSFEELKQNDYKTLLEHIDITEDNESNLFVAIEAMYIAGIQDKQQQNKAIEALQAKYPNDAIVYMLKAEVANQRKEFDKSIDAYTKAIELDPDDAKTYTNRGAAKYDLKQYEAAIKDYTKAIEIDPKLAGAYSNRGNSKAGLKQHKEAIKDYDEAIELDPNDAEAYYNRGVAKYNLEQYEEAIKDYDKSLKLDPNDAEAYYNRGVAKYNLEQYEEAIKDYDKALKLDPKFAGAYSNRGLAKAELKQYQEAIEDYDKAIELDPSDVEAYHAI